MPDPIVMAQAMGLALVASALVLGVCAWWGRRSAARPAWIEAGSVLGAGAGFYLGCRWLGLWPHWPPSEDLDRLMILVVPAALAVELLAAFPRVPRWLVWPLRVAVVGCSARVLLHGSIYLSDAAGPASGAWPPWQAVLILGSLGAAGAVVGILLDRLARRVPGAPVLVGLAIAAGGSAITIMLSGYATGGQAGLPLAAALLGASAVALVLPGPSRPTAPIGVAVVGLLSLLVMGRFFGELRTAHAVLLLAAPLLAWLPELPRLRRLPPWARGLARVLLVGVLVAGVLADATRRFAAENRPAGAPGANEPSIEDYMNPEQ
jgi:hypothetical protein